jgi:hypothetical protein
MHKLQTIALSLLTFAVIVLTCGCDTSFRYDDVPLTDQSLYKELSTNLKNIYPEQFKVVHRVVITIFDRQIDANGYLVVSGNDDYRLSALGDFGNVFFDVSSKNGKVTINKNALEFSEDKFREGIVKDIKAVCLHVPDSQMQLVQLSDGRPALTYSENKETYFFVFDTDHQLQEYVITKNAKCTYKAEFKQWKQLPGLRTKIPTVTHTTNKPYHYGLVIDTIKIEDTSLK